MQPNTQFIDKLKQIHTQALAQTDTETAAALRQSELCGKFREHYSSLASRLNREIVMPTLIQFAGAIPNVSGPREANEKWDEDFETYDAVCEIAPVTVPEPPVKLRLRIRADADHAGLTIECEITSKEAELFHDATDLAVEGIERDKLQNWIEDAVSDAYRRFCELNYAPTSR